MNQPISKSVLSEPQSRLVELLQRINFGRVERLLVKGGVPLFEPAPRVIQKLKMGGDNTPRPETELQDFFLKRPIFEMLQAISDLGEGVVLSIDIKHGLPFAIEVEGQVEAGGLGHA